MNADPHTEIAFADGGEICERLVKDGTPAAHILTALPIHDAGIAKALPGSIQWLLRPPTADGCAALNMMRRSS